MSAFTLRPEQVPDFPSATTWADQLRWCLAVMDAYDPELAFTASLLSYAARDGLSERQAKSANKIVRRVLDAWEGGRLDCQADEPSTNVVPLSRGTRP